jgi:hypothetical protein
MADDHLIRPPGARIRRAIFSRRVVHGGDLPSTSITGEEGLPVTRRRRGAERPRRALGSPLVRSAIDDGTHAGQLTRCKAAPLRAERLSERDAPRRTNPCSWRGGVIVAVAPIARSPDPVGRTAREFYRHARARSR